MTRSFHRVVPLAVVALVGLLTSPSAAAPGTVGPLAQVSGPSPFGGCTADFVDLQRQLGSRDFPGSEVEPWIASSLVDRSGDGVPDLIAGYQQDRWSNGGARGVYASVLHNGAWQQVAIPGVSTCLGGSRGAGTDPWVTFSPDGDARTL